VVRRDGSGLRQITMGADFTDRVPRWSPDGRWIAFFSNRAGGYELWKIRPDGSDMQQLTEVPDASFPAWSPDGSRIAVSMTAGAGHADDTYIFDPNRPWKSQTPERLPSLGAGDDAFVANSWSGDGARLAGMAGLAGRAIVTYSLAKRTYERLTSHGGYPVWLPDNQHVLFVSGGKAFLVLDTVSKKTREVFSVKRDVIGPPQLSRDGHELYFSRRVTEADIWVLTLAARDRTSK
jgi:Tol biopolymer transport system component